LLQRGFRLTDAKFEVGCIQLRDRLTFLDRTAKVDGNFQQTTRDFESEDYFLIRRERAGDCNQLIDRLFFSKDRLNLTGWTGRAIAPAFAIGWCLRSGTASG